MGLFDKVRRKKEKVPDADSGERFNLIALSVNRP
jgi:hypothetical protein